MESANLQHQLQELFVGYSSLISAPKPTPITHESTPNIILDENCYNNNPYNLMDQSLQCSRENENQWFNFSSNYQTNYEQHQISTTNIFSSSMQSPNSSYGGFQGISNTHNYYNNVFSSSTRNNNASTLDLLSSSSLSSSMDNNLEADYNNSRSPLFGYIHQLHDHHHHVQDSIDDHKNTPSISSNKISQTSIARAKRPFSSLSMPQKSNNINIIPQSKKPSSTSRTSCPPLKVRKEKLGDRISALQRLVAPFGKTDTSSVLSEAIGYIQFLHDQVGTLSMPYLGSSQSKPYQKLQHGFLQEKDETKERQNLRSRGLCLMPLSTASFINGYD